MSSTPNQRHEVGLRSYKIIAWVCILFFLACSAGAFFAKQYGPALFFWVFILMGIYVLVSGGSFALDEEGVSHINVRGHYRMLWREIQEIELGTQGSVVLHGVNKRFVMPSPAMWSGPNKPKAFELLDRKIKELGITPYPSNVADYKIHKNVKVSSTSA